MEVTLIDLWLPILLSSVAVFIASFLAWMVLPHHKKDWVKLPDESGFIASLKSLGVPPGQYMFPFCDMKDMKDPEAKARWMAGPYGNMNLLPTRPNFVANLIKVFVFYIVVSVLTAYIAANARAAGAEFGAVFQIAATAAIMGYALGAFPHANFTGRTPRSVLMDTVDGVVYGLITGAIFAWLWPIPANPLPAIGG